jgi:ribosomal protein S18 acetylase RimI-like enzyme
LLVAGSKYEKEDDGREYRGRQQNEPGPRSHARDYPDGSEKERQFAPPPVLFFARPRASLGAVKIRPVEPDDTEDVADVFLAALAGMSYLPDLYTDAETRTFIRDVLLPNNEVWVAEKGGRVVGFAGLGEDVLRHLWVEPEAQNRGVGTALLALAKERRPQGLWLSVFQKNTGARRFYERHGFTLAELTDGRDNEEHEPDARYEWRPKLRSANPS